MGPCVIDGTASGISFARWPLAAPDGYTQLNLASVACEHSPFDASAPFYCIQAAAVFSVGDLLQLAKSLGARLDELVQDVYALLEGQGHLRTIALQCWIGSKQDVHL